MKRILTLVSAIAIPTLGFAATMDTDGDGLVSLAEAQAVMPELTEKAFLAMDTDADGFLNAEEIAAAQEGGALPTMN